MYSVINHSNTLGLIRALGRNNVMPFVILINGKWKNNYCAKSKFLQGARVVATEDEALKYLKDMSIDKSEKPVVFPSSDGAEFMIDTHFDELKDKFILPVTNEKAGEISFLMNKSIQSAWCDQLGIEVAKCMEVDLDNLEMGGQILVSLHSKTFIQPFR